MNSEGRFISGNQTCYKNTKNIRMEIDKSGQWNRIKNQKINHISWDYLWECNIQPRFNSVGNDRGYLINGVHTELASHLEENKSIFQLILCLEIHFLKGRVYAFT